jgi:hypothetical protein
MLHAPRRFTAEMPLALVAVVVAAAALPVTGASAVPPSSKTVPASVKHLCSTIDPSFVSDAGVTAPCVQLKPLLGGKTFVACYAANWGSVLTEEGSDHALGVEVCLPRSPTFLARQKLAVAHEIASGRVEAMKNGDFEEMTYDREKTFEKEGEEQVEKFEGFKGGAGFIQDGYVCTVALFERSHTDPPSSATFQQHLLAIAASLRKAA